MLLDDVEIEAALWEAINHFLLTEGDWLHSQSKEQIRDYLQDAIGLMQEQDDDYY